MKIRSYILAGISILIMMIVISSLAFAKSAQLETDITNEIGAINEIDATIETNVTNKTSATIDTAATNETSILDTSDMFTERDLLQSPSLQDAVSYTVTSDSDIHITEEGIYVLTGTASNSTIYVEAPDDANVQLVLDGLSISNQDFPCIYITSSDKVFITTLGNSALNVTGTFRADGETNTDGVIFSRSDIVLNGTSELMINSTDNGIVSKDDLKITGGSYVINTDSTTIKANDSIRIYNGTLELTAGADGLHAENEDDDSLGYVYICGGTLQIDAGDDAIHATSVLQIDDGDITTSGAEGLESTCIQINGGTLNISSWDDGINASSKSSSYAMGIEINDGEITISMGQGDTDGIDSNGYLTVNGGTIDITGMSSFDVDGAVEYNGGTIIVNGTQMDEILVQFGMGGPGGMVNSSGM